jgi:restriction endonuclease S subunit
MSITAFKSVSLGEIARISAGYPFRGAVDALERGPVAVIQMRNVDSDMVDYETVTRVSLPTSRQPDFLEAGDVIFTTRGRRNSALALDDVPGLAVCSPHFFVLKVVEPDALLPTFLAWQINQKPAQEYLQQAATGSHILNITRGAIERLPVAIPPMEMQRALVAMSDEARRERQVMNALIENRQSQLNAIATHILTPERFPPA